MRWCLQNLERTLNISFSAIKNANPWCQASPSAEKCKIRVIPLRYQRIISLPRHALPSSSRPPLLAVFSHPSSALLSSLGPSLLTTPSPPQCPHCAPLLLLCSSESLRCALLAEPITCRLALPRLQCPCVLTEPFPPCCVLLLATLSLQRRARLALPSSQCLPSLQRSPLLAAPAPLRCALPFPALSPPCSALPSFQRPSSLSSPLLHCPVTSTLALLHSTSFLNNNTAL